MLLEEIVDLPSVVHGGWFITIFLDYQAGDPNVVGLVGGIRDSVVSHERVGRNEYLATVGGVSDILLVSTHGGCENDFSRDCLLISEGYSLENRSVLKNKIVSCHRDYYIGIFYLIPTSKLRQPIF